jgi:hypothetical protein
MRRLGIALIALAACGGSTSLSPDGGGADARSPSDVTPAEVGRDGSGVFAVKAALTLAPFPGQSQALDPPTSHAFTMRVDAATSTLVAGAHGRGAMASLASTGAAAFKTTSRVSLAAPQARACTGLATVDYEVITFSIAGGRLTGAGKGRIEFIVGDVIFDVAFTAVLSGEPDAEPPSLSVPGATIDPMGGAVFPVSEPLDPSAAASLIGDGGDVFALGGVSVPEGLPFTTAFVRSPLMLNWGTTYEVTTEALLDLAGHMGVRAQRPRVATPAAPPLIGEDGFESVTGTMFAGAGVLSGGVLSPIAGGKSLLVSGGHGNALGNLGYVTGTSFAVRLPIQSGDTVVRLSVRFVSPTGGATPTFFGQLRAGVPGREVSERTNLAGKDLEPTGVGMLSLGPVTTVEVPLPLNAAGEASFEIVGQLSSCGLPPPPAVLIIDDLRVE